MCSFHPICHLQLITWSRLQTIVVSSGGSDAFYTSINPPSIVSVIPQFGMASETISVAVSGANLAQKMQQHTYCILFDNSGMVTSNLAEHVNGNSTLVNCQATCPSHNATERYSLCISIGSADQVDFTL